MQDNRNVNFRVSELRKIMSANGIKAYIIPSSDSHQSEYVAEHALCRAWISGFTGSAGTAVVTQDHAGLWTDVRYFLQAEQELKDSTFELHKVENQQSQTYTQWLCEHFGAGDIVAVDGYNFSLDEINTLTKKLEAEGIQLQANHDLISAIWQDRPSLPKDPIFKHAKAFVDVTTQQKVAQILEKTKADFVLLSALDDVVWTLNLRGNDVEFNPVFIAYLLVGKSQSILFVDPEKVSSSVRDYLTEANIEIQPYTSIVGHLNSLAENVKVSIDPSICSYTLSKHINGEVIHEPSKARILKAVKTPKEITHIRRAMIKDAVALAKAFVWLDKNIAKETITEYTFAMKLAGFRAQEDNYYGESFPAIIGYKGNGAIIHYRPAEETAATIKPSGVLLADSGGQYYDGTTDITRTIALGEDVSADAKKAFTLVLKGMIALDKAKFPIGTQGGQLDILARLPLWQHGLNYLHGTGHGVGYFLNVHEPPQGFTAGTSSRSNTTFEVGMLTSNEPGYYKEGEYGIRLENLIICKESEVPGFLEHESLTLFPIDQKMMQVDLLTSEEISWLNTYHHRVFTEVAPSLIGAELAWMEHMCRPL